ncbi:hypothetical protein D3C81_1574060 [compost metagenome]
MHGQQQHMMIVSQTHQPSTNQRIVLQIKRCRGFLRQQYLQGVLGLRLLAQIFYAQQQTVIDRGNRHLRGVVEADETAAQGFVAGDDPRQRRLQGIDVEVTAQAQAERNVVRRVATRHLRKKPQALLGEGHRQRLITRCRQDLR